MPLPSQCMQAALAEALQLTQDLIRRGNAGEVLERIELESGNFGERLKSDEVRNAVNAFFERKARPRD